MLGVIRRCRERRDGVRRTGRPGYVDPVIGRIGKRQNQPCRPRIVDVSAHGAAVDVRAPRNSGVVLRSQDVRGRKIPKLDASVDSVVITKPHSVVAAVQSDVMKIMVGLITGRSGQLNARSPTARVPRVICPLVLRSVFFVRIAAITDDQFTGGPLNDAQLRRYGDVAECRIDRGLRAGPRVGGGMAGHAKLRVPHSDRSAVVLDPNHLQEISILNGAGRVHRSSGNRMRSGVLRRPSRRQRFCRLVDI